MMKIMVSFMILLSIVPLKISTLAKSQSWDRRGTYLTSQCPWQIYAADSLARQPEEVLAATNPCSPPLVGALQ